MTTVEKIQGLTREHILLAIREIDEEGIRNGRHSSTYDVNYQGKNYPPKLLISIASRFAYGEELASDSFTGGKGTDAFQLLEKNEFEIIPKNDPIADLIKNYKRFIQRSKLEDESYKWELVAKFSGRPNPNASNFTQEYGSVDFANLIYQMAGAVGKHLSEAKPEELRGLFKSLFNEEESLNFRIRSFQSGALELYRSIGEKLGHHQDERTISAYLTYYDPSKYTFYKNSYYKSYCELIGVKPAKKNEKYSHYLELINDFITQYIEEDLELIDMMKTFLPEWYDGMNHLLLAQDIWYCSFDRKDEFNLDLNVKSTSNNHWTYSPGKNACYWKDFLEEGVMGMGWNELGDISRFKEKSEIVQELQRIEETDGSKKNDATANWDFVNTIEIGDMIFAKKGRSELLGYGIVTGDYQYDPSRPNQHHFRTVDWKHIGNWKVDHVLSLKTLTNVSSYTSDLPNIDYYWQRLLFEIGALNQHTTSILKPMNKILYGPPGTGKTYKLKSEYFEKYVTKETSISEEQHFSDVVRELTWWQVIAIALIEEGKTDVTGIYNNRWVTRKAELSNSNTVRPTIWGQLQSHTIDECEFVNVRVKQQPLIFNKSHDSFWELLSDESKNQCPELYEILNKVNHFEPNPDKVVERHIFTTFHQSYSYEDFIEGIKPIMSTDESQGSIGYAIENGIFKDLCIRAASDPENRYAIFIDEINRGNVSAIFGELITLIEIDKRKNGAHPMSVTLPYSKKPFSVPSNVDIIGTMNTADRSVESLDTALRRRFTFEEMLPNPKLLTQIVDSISLKSLLEVINERIEVLVDRDHTIGHAFFMGISTLDELRLIFANEVIPLLQEYFYGDYYKMEMVIGSAFFHRKDASKVRFAVPSDNFYPEGKVYQILNISDKNVMPDEEFVLAIETLIEGTV